MTVDFRLVPVHLIVFNFRSRFRSMIFIHLGFHKGNPLGQVFLLGNHPVILVSFHPAGTTTTPEMSLEKLGYTVVFLLEMFIFKFRRGGSILCSPDVVHNDDTTIDVMGFTRVISEKQATAFLDGMGLGDIAAINGLSIHGAVVPLTDGLAIITKDRDVTIGDESPGDTT